MSDDERPSILGPQEIRAAIPAGTHRRSSCLAWGLLAAWSSLYAVMWVAIFRVPGPLRLPCAIVDGTFVGVLFVIAHDACHGSFAPARWMNHVIGRIAFLPSLHGFAHWEEVHNRLHHGWTNLRSQDTVWAPFSKAEFDGLPRWRRLVERAGRTLFGVAIHYAVVIWWPRFLCPSRDQRARAGRVGTYDWLLELGFLAGQLLVALRLEVARDGRWSVLAIATAFLLGIVVPWCVFVWMLGMVTFVQHNHERVRWFDRRNEWSFAAGALFGTVHVELPAVLDRFLLNCMFHTAHHVDVRVPLYHLPAAQRAIEDAYGERVVRTRATLGSALDTFRRCKLYDYRAREWLDFDGVPTAAVRAGAADPRSLASRAAVTDS